MGEKGGRNKLKRLAAPRSWDISRKSDRFVFKPMPGPHQISSSYPLGVVVRDLMSLADLSKELKYIMNNGKVLVDGIERRTSRFPVGLFNVVSVPAEKADYRLVPSPKGLVLAKVGSDEARTKLCSVRTKTKIKGGHIQYGLHDGRSIVDDGLKLAPGDAVLLEVPSQKVVGQAKLAKGSLGLVLTGDRAGQLGKIAEVKDGTISREKMIRLTLPSGETEVPSRLVFPVGTTAPMITVGAGAK
ncbi:MAG: 30S ribosomal protein S4e [Nitrososphaerota archaeon]|nr:30S ribosomal protein S4e [Nitrososphaerota archaeon]